MVLTRPLKWGCIAESFYDIKYWNVNYHLKGLSENCWFLAHCFFSVIWNISQINVFKTKFKSKCQNDFLWNYFWNLVFEIWKHQCLYFMFSLLIFIWWTLEVIIDVSVFDVLKGLCFNQQIKPHPTRWHYSLINYLATSW